MIRGNSRNGRLAAALLLATALPAAAPAAGPAVTPTEGTADLEIVEAGARHLHDLALVVFEQKLEGTAGGTVPEAAGGMDGAPVLGYVFPTTLDPSAVGFGDVEGTLALVVTSHPDFDDTPLWDEDGSAAYGDDGAVFHSHWVVLQPNDRVPGGLSVREFDEGDAVTLPPTNPGMPLYLDSPGLTVVLDGDTLRILVPAWRMRGETDFRFDAVTAYLEVNTSDESRPMLGVYAVYDVASGDLSMPFEVKHAE